MTINQVLNADRVRQIFVQCKSLDGPHRIVVVDGVVTVPKVSFDANQLAEHHTEIGAMLAELPAEFQPPSSGYSLGVANIDKHGEPWVDTTTEEGAMLVEWLVQLGLATGQVTYLLPRGDWPSLYEGKPHFRVI